MARKQPRHPRSIFPDSEPVTRFSSVSKLPASIVILASLRNSLVTASVFAVVLFSNTPTAQSGLPPGFKSKKSVGSTAARASASAPARTKTKKSLPPLEIPPEAQFGFALRDVAQDSLLAGYDEDRAFTPGSTQKLFVTWTALEMLGAEKTFTTELLRTGNLEKGKLDGDIIIRGGGDPSLGVVELGPSQSSDSLFAFWTSALRNLGVTQVEGCVHGDGSYLEEEGPSPAALWEDAGNYYGATPSGLCYNGNTFSAAFSGAKLPGQPVAFLGASPSHTGIGHFENQLLTGPSESRDSAFILGGWPATSRLLRGTYPAGRMPFYLKGSLPNPAWTCARQFQDYLSAHGIAFVRPSGGPNVGFDVASNGGPNVEPNLGPHVAASFPKIGKAGTPSGAKGKSASCGDSTQLPNRIPSSAAIVIPGSQHVSPPLKELIRHTNQKSDNLFAAQFLALIGKEALGKGDTRSGLKAMNDFLAKRGIPSERLHLKDGNGLSRYNWVPPDVTCRLLCSAAREKSFPDFKASLVGGPGSEERLDRFGKGWQGKLWVKTGTLDGVSGLAGYMKTGSGRLLAFALILNNFDAHGLDAQRFFIPYLRDWSEKY